MAQSLTHDVLILGAGLAGLRAAVELSHRTEGHIDIGIVSKVQLMRAHSVCAEGGTAAVLREDEGDSIALHAWDSVKGSDFLLEGGVFTPDLIDTWIDYKRTQEVLPIALRPHPHEFELYYDI